MGLDPKVRDQRPLRGRYNRALEIWGSILGSYPDFSTPKLEGFHCTGFFGGNLQHRGNKGQGGFSLGAGVPGVGVLDAWKSGFEEATNT